MDLEELIHRLTEYREQYGNIMVWVPENSANAAPATTVVHVPYRPAEQDKYWPDVTYAARPEHIEINAG